MSHIVIKKGAYFEREGWILGGSHIVVGGIFWYILLGVYSSIFCGYILGGRGRFWEGRTNTFVEKWGIFSHEYIC